MKAISGTFRSRLMGLFAVQLANRQSVRSTPAALTKPDRMRIKMAAIPLPPAEYLRQCFDYDPETGILTWRERPREHFARNNSWRSFNRRYPGRQAGDNNGAYVILGIRCQLYKAHRVIWALVHDVDPDLFIDHIDGDGTNNRLSNLRLATRAENCRNRKSSVVGKLKGASLHRASGKWRARIYIDGKLTHLGLFATEQDAHAVYCRAAKEHYGEFARMT